MSKDPFCSTCIFGSDEGCGSDRSCTRCRMIPGRPNFISIYKDGRRPEVAGHTSRDPIKRASENRISTLVRTASRKRRSLDKRKIGTWALLTDGRALA